MPLFLSNLLFHLNQGAKQIAVLGANAVFHPAFEIEHHGFPLPGLIFVPVRQIGVIRIAGAGEVGPCLPDAAAQLLRDGNPRMVENETIIDSLGCKPSTS